MCTSLLQRFYCRLNLWGQISVKFPGVQLRDPQMHFQTRKHNRYTATCKQFYLPSPRHSFLHCSIKGKRLFSLFPAKWILYPPCVCKSNLCFPECKGWGALLLISLSWKSSTIHITTSQISHLLDTTAHRTIMIACLIGKIYFICSKKDTWHSFSQDWIKCN